MTLFIYLQYSVHAVDRISCAKLIKSVYVDTTSKCVKTVKKLDKYTRIGEYSVLNGGEYGRYLDVGSFVMLGTGIVAGDKVRIGNGVCIGNGVQLKNNAWVNDETAIHIEMGKQMPLRKMHGQRYILKNGKCKSENA